MNQKLKEYIHNQKEYVTNQEYQNIELLRMILIEIEKKLKYAKINGIIYRIEEKDTTIHCNGCKLMEHYQQEICTAIITNKKKEFCMSLCNTITNVDFIEITDPKELILAATSIKTEEFIILKRN